jgi:uncharacterized membrane protein YjjB (DUF3815 family)
MLAQAITSFISSVAFGFIFNVPKSSLIKCGLIGMVSWVLYYSLYMDQVNVIWATFIGAFTVAIVSQFFARIYKTPMTVFSVSGIIPLVPGGIAYDAMRHFVLNDYNMAIELAAKAFMLSGAIAFGLIISEVLNQLYRKAFEATRQRKNKKI